MKRVLVGSLAAICLISGVSVYQGRHRAAAIRSARIHALPPAMELLAYAQHVGLCLDPAAPGVFSLHTRNTTPTSVSVKKTGSSTEVSAVAGSGVTTDAERDRLADAYRASGEKPEMDEAVLEALDLKVVPEAQLRC